MVCDKNAVAKTASTQEAKATLQFEYTEIQDGGEEGRCKKKKGGGGGNNLKMFASYYYCPRSCSLSALSFHFLTKTTLFSRNIFLRCTVFSPGDRNRCSLEVNGDVRCLNVPLNTGSLPKRKHFSFDPFDICPQ